MSGEVEGSGTRRAVPALLRPSRRELLRTGLMGSAVLAFASLAGARARSEAAGQEEGEAEGFHFLTPADRDILGAIAPVVLAGALPENARERAEATAEVVRGADLAISGLAPMTQSELRQLFDLLDLGIARLLVVGLWDPWERAEPVAIAAFLQRWRTSRFSLLRTAYLALHELIVAAWYGNPRSWPRIGYPGPPELG